MQTHATANVLICRCCADAVDNHVLLKRLQAEMSLTLCNKAGTPGVGVHLLTYRDSLEIESK